MKNNSRIGKYVDGNMTGHKPYKAYVPKKLPPHPHLEMDRLYKLSEQASSALGRLDGLSLILPNTSLFLYMYVRKEAVLSSQIEGTQSSLSDLLLFENDQIPGVPLDEITEVSCYVSAMNYGLERLEEIPLSLRLIKEIHKILMKNNRGGNKQPGEFRKTQNWIGGASPDKAILVPPPPEEINNCLHDLELFFHDKNIKLPSLIKAALIHVQFETIHPFLDGNGRLGRLLITLILCTEKLLDKPILYLSLYFKTYRNEYYNHLQSVRETGDWETWVIFFLKGIIETADQAVQTAKAIIELFEMDLAKIQNSNKSTAAILTVHNFLQQNPVTNTKRIRQTTKLSQPTVMRSLKALENMGIVKEISGKERHKIFTYQKYIDILNKGTEPV